MLWLLLKGLIFMLVLLGTILFLLSILDEYKNDLLCWLMNKYCGKYFTKKLILKQNIHIELSMNNGRLELVSLDLNCDTLNKIAEEKGFRCTFLSVDFRRFTVSTDFTDIFLNLEDLRVSVSPKVAPRTLLNDPSLETRNWLLMFCISLPIVYFFVPILIPLGAILSTIVVSAVAAIGITLAVPKLQEYGAEYLLNKYAGKYFQGGYISHDQLEMNLWNGWAKLMNVVIDRDVLNDIANQNKVPIKFIEVRANSVSVKVPWKNFTLNNSKLNLTEVSITVQPKYESDLGSEMYKKIMLKVLSAFVALVKSYYPTNAIKAIQLQLENVASTGKVFVKPIVDFNMNEGIITLVTQSVPKKKVVLEEKSFSYRKDESRRKETRTEKASLFSFVGNAFETLADAVTNIPNVFEERREVLYN